MRVLGFAGAGLIGTLAAMGALEPVSAGGGLEFDRRSPKPREPAAEPTDPTTETRQMRRARERRERKATA